MATHSVEQNHTCRDPLCSEFLSAIDRDHFQQCVETVKKTVLRPPPLGSCHFMDGSNRAPVALASFEGSGNTWIRGLLEEVTGICTGKSSVIPRPPFNITRGKGGLVNIVQHFCRSTEFQRDNLIG